MPPGAGKRLLSDAGARLAQAVALEVEYLALEIGAYLQSVIPSYAELQLDTLTPAIERDLTSIAKALTSGHPPDEAEIKEMAAPADQRARQGVPIEGVLATYRVGGRYFWDWIETRASAFDVGPEDLLSISRMMSEWFDAVTAEIALVHRGAEVELARRDAGARAEFLYGLLFGALPPAQLRVRAATYDLKAEEPYRAFRARVWDEHTRRRLESRLLTAGSGRTSFVGMIETDLVGVVSARPELPAELDVICAVGPALELGAADVSYRIASRVLDTALTFGLRGVVTLTDLGPRVAVATERELGDDLVNQYITPVVRLGAFGAELVTTLREYLKQGLRVEVTAEALYVHPNTVRHRLQRFEEVTGADTRSFEDLIHVWWALERSRIDVDESLATDLASSEFGDPSGSHRASP